MRTIKLTFLVSLCACTQFPALDSVEGPEVEAAEYPRLLTAEELAAAPTSTTSLQVQSAVLDRVRALRARAQALSGPVIDPATRARMLRGVR